MPYSTVGVRVEGLSPAKSTQNWSAEICKKLLVGIHVCYRSNLISG